MFNLGPIRSLITMLQGRLVMLENNYMLIKVNGVWKLYV